MFHRCVRLFFVSAFLSICLSTAVQAQECGPLKILTSVDLRMAADNRAAFAPVTLQGKTMYMLVDTGGSISEVTPKVVATLGLESHKTQGMRFFDTRGNSVDHATVVPDFAIGNLTAHNADFVIGPDDLFKENPEIAGIIGPGILRFYDVAFDFANRKLTFISQDHCEGKVIYWKADAVAVVPMALTGMVGHIVVPVILDGHKLNALIDTGANDSVLNLREAEGDFGLTTKQPDMAPIALLGDRDHSVVYQHRFKSLAFEGIGVANPTFDIIPDVRGNHMDSPPPLGSRIKDPNTELGLPDMLVGMDILRHLHLYIAYKERKLYITPASAPEASAPGAATPAASTPAPAH